MRIERLEPRSWGHLRDVALDLSVPQKGLSIIYGPNEAGKSTTRRAFIAALFGILNSTPDAYMHGRSALEIAFKLRASGGETYELLRRGHGTATLVANDGTPAPADLLDSVLGPVRRDTFVRLFCIDHEELRSRSENLLSAGGDIGELVFGASLGGGSVGDLLRKLEDRATELFSPRGSKQAIVKGLNAYRDDVAGSKKARVRSKDWDRRVIAHREVKKEVESISGRLRAMKVELVRAERVRRTLPRLAERDDFAKRLGELGESGPVPSPDWASRARCAIAARDSAFDAWSSLTRQHQALLEALEAKAADEPILAHALEIDQLVQRLERYRKDSLDLGKLKGSLVEAQSQLKVHLRALGIEADDGRIYSDAQLASVEALAKQYAELIPALSRADEELAKVNRAISDGKAKIAQLAEPLDTSGLERALELALPALAAANNLDQLRIRLEAQHVAAAEAASRLGLGDRPRANLGALEVPSAVAIQREMARQDEQARRLRDLGEKLAQVLSSRTELGAEIGSIRAKPGVPDPFRLFNARSERDELWMRLRDALVRGAAPEDQTMFADAKIDLADAVAEAIREADEAGDERFEHANDLALLEGLEQRLSQSFQEDAEIQAALASEGETAELGAQAWTSLWTAIGVRALDPADMLVWREGYRELRELLEKTVPLEGEIKVAELQLSLHEREVAKELVAIGETPSSQHLGHLIAQGRQVVDQQRELRESLRVLNDLIHRETLGLPERQSAEDNLGESLASWSQRWSVACARLSLEPGIEPQAAMAAVRAYQDLLGARSQVEQLGQRIDGIGRDMDDFDSRVEQVREELPGFDAQQSDQAVEVLSSRLTAGRSTQSAREVLIGQRDQVAQDLTRANQELELAQSALGILALEAGVEGSEELAQAVDRSEEAGGLVNQIAEIEAALRRDGGGLSLDSIVDEARNSTGGDALSVSIEDLTRDISTLEDELAQANIRLGMASGELEKVSGDELAADLDQNASIEIAGVAENVETYARYALGAEILRRVTRAYGEANRGPLLDRAGSIFSNLTGGAFPALIPDVLGESPILLARRRNNEYLPTSALSDGVRDQLYLALRLAGLWHQLSQLREAVPVILDDVLVNFDDENSRRALRAFDELGDATQVVLFTHHRRIVELARESISASRLGVIELEPRNQDIAVLAGGDSRAHQTGIVGASNKSGRSDAILSCVAGAFEPISKQEILAQTGLSEGEWNGAIRALVDSGRIVQEGQKRGARYRSA